MLDIKEGDQLVVGSDTFLIRAVMHYDAFGSTASFKRLATVTASVKRRPNVASNERAAPATIIASLKCTPLDPVSNEIAQTLGLKQPYRAKQCMAADASSFAQIVVMDKEF